jgi:peptide/nickel transport system substrate-binding protein
VLAAGALLLALACTTPVPDPVESNTIRALFSADPLSLTLIGKGDRYSTELGYLLSDPLVQYDAGLELRPRVAESWEVADDLRSVTFRLRRGIRWHDGAPLTARDVRFTIEKVRDPRSEARAYASGFDRVTEVEVVDDFTVRAHYDEPYVDLLNAWTVPLIPEHAAGADEDLLTGAFAQRPIGCGAFRFVEYVEGQRLVLEANETYWGGRPAVDRLVWRFFPDERTGFQAFLGGEVDLMPATPDIWNEAKQARRDRPFEHLLYSRFNVWYLGWNQDGSNPFFGDARVRRAMTLSLDREAMSERTFSGLARPGITTYHPDSPWTDPGLEPWPHDPDASRRLLAEAGWTDSDGDGVREKDGVPFAFTLLVRKSSQEIVNRMAEWIQDSLSKVGVEAEIETLEARAYTERVRAFEFQGMMGGLNFDTIPDQYEMYHTSGRENGFNYVGLADAEVDELVRLGRHTADPEERLRVYHRLQRRLHELEPLTCIFNFASTYLFDSRLAGLESSPLGVWRTTPGAHGWRWTGATAGN